MRRNSLLRRHIIQIRLTKDGEDILANLLGTSAASSPSGVTTVAPLSIPDALISDEVLQVNAKQYHRILKRRATLARLRELGKLKDQRKPYLHESRHKHAMSRPRGPGGRFLTVEETKALREKEALQRQRSVTPQD
ncbi:hypothetical protein BT69DRAFT_1005163 [Atractiella rhizophila]|nr:hypothetical protein BT69DRAFT_1005163 [Atractiella rhizophila]